MQIRVYYEDTDSGKVIYYASYLRFCERARTEFFRERGIDIGMYDAAGVLFVVAHVDITYRSPGHYNDLLEIETSVTATRRASFTFYHRILRTETTEPLAEARVRLVCVNEKGKPISLPQEVKRIVDEELGQA